MSKVKVAVLGGGVAALTTAFELTSTEELRAKYEVTVYQMGWRLGGKGASGRNRAIANRIEEHGLHIWMGFYENAFKVMQDAYAELGRKPGEPLATWKDAFHRHSYIVLEEKLDDGFHPWSFVFPTNYLEPGTGGVLPTPLAYVEMLIKWIIELWEGSDAATTSLPAGESPPSIPGWVTALVAAIGGDASGAGAVDHDKGHGTVLSTSAPTATHPVSLLAAQALKLLSSLEKDAASHSAIAHHGIAWLIDALMGFAWLFLQGSVNTNLETRKIWVGLNLAGSAAAGILTDGIVFKGWDSIDDLDLRAWLKKYGANDVTLDSSPLRGIYDLVFGYIGGEIKEGAFAAGTAMRGILRMLLTYKGAIFFRMQAGMGDVVAAPLFQVLEKRGVKFEFFHRVTALRLSEDASLVQRIELKKQVKLAPGLTSYPPLFGVNGLPCWPSAPRYEHISDGAELEAAGINLESSWAKPWKDEEDVTLELGTHFDQVVLGISIAALKDVAKDLIAASPALARSVEKVQTTQTQALQLWMKSDTTALGWRAPQGVTEAPVLGAFFEPIDTWADMSDLLRRESWPDDHQPKSIAYFCGPFTDAAVIPPFTDHEFPQRELDRYAKVVRPFMDEQLRGLWPNAVAPKGFMWELLVDLKNQIGPTRLESQFMRVNIDPTERYVLSVPGSTQYRLRADELPFGNVVLTGDWTRCGLNAGCVEATVMSGLYASRAMCGVPEIIIGDESG